MLLISRLRECAKYHTVEEADMIEAANVLEQARELARLVADENAPLDERVYVPRYRRIARELLKRIG